MTVGGERLYLDHNASAPLVPAAREALQRALHEAGGNPSSAHAEGRASRRLLEEARELAPMRRLFNKSVVARTDLAAGTRLREEDLALKKPGDGIPASELHSVVGRTLARALAADDPIREADLE